MATLQQVRDALGQTIRSFAANPPFIYPTVAEVVSLPAIVIEPGHSDFNGAMAMGNDVWQFHVYVLCQRGWAEGAQDTLDGFVDGHGPNSIREILYHNSSLGLSGVDASVTGVFAYGGNWEVTRVAHVGAALRLKIHVDPS